MTRENLLGSQLKRLLSGLSDHVNGHLTEVETDLMQTNVLLTEAIEKLGASFMAIHEAVTLQQTAVDTLLTGSSATPELTAQVKTMQHEIGLQVNAAVTGLQFQDMTSQLIGRTIRRVAGLRDVLGAVGAVGSGMVQEADTAQIVAILTSINQTLEEQSGRLESVLWKAVTQTHMDSGDIELF